MVEADLGRRHQRGGDRRGARVPGQLADLGNVPPPAEVLGERAGIIGAAGHQGKRAWVGDHGVDAPGGSGHLAGVQHPAHAHHAVGGEGRDKLLVNTHQVHGPHCNPAMANGDAAGASGRAPLSTDFQK